MNHTPTQISTLNNLEAYLKLPGNLPITKLQMKLEHPPEVAPAFLKKEISSRVYGLTPSLEGASRKKKLPQGKEKNKENPTTSAKKRKPRTSNASKRPQVF